MIKVVHIITGLNIGGAETMLFKLLSTMDRTDFESRVISLTTNGPVGAKIEGLGIPVQALGMRRGMPNPRSLLRLTRWLRESPAQVIQTWMYHADLMGSLAALRVPGSAVAWNIRHSELDPRTARRTTIWISRACARLSHRIPRRILCCSEEARRAHERLGYAADKMRVIPNGFDTRLFHPDPAAREDVRCELGIPVTTPLIGLVGRFHPMKDQHNFIQAAAHLHACLPTTHFLLCGDGIHWENPTLAQWIEAAGLRAHCHLLGRRQDIPRLTAAFDIATSASNTEGFPNVLGEAMACGVPCVATDVGDSARILGETGRIVPPRNPQALAQALEALLTLSPTERCQLGTTARARIESHFSLPAITAQYQALYQEIAAPCAD